MNQDGSGVGGLSGRVHPADWETKTKGQKKVQWKRRRWFEVNESNINLSKAEIEGLISERNEAKKTKNYERADMIRDELMEQGIEIMDNSSGTSWKVKT